MNYVQKVALLEELCPEELRDAVIESSTNGPGYAPMIIRYLLESKGSIKRWRRDPAMEHAVDQVWGQFTRAQETAALPTDFLDAS